MNDKYSVTALILFYPPTEEAAAHSAAPVSRRQQKSVRNMRHKKRFFEPGQPRSASNCDLKVAATSVSHLKFAPQAVTDIISASTFVRA